MPAAAAAAAAGAAILHPAFEDHNWAAFLCNTCMCVKKANLFEPAHLSEILGDCQALRPAGTVAGPWRGVLMRVGKDGVGYIHSTVFSRSLGLGHQVDVKMPPALTQALPRIPYTQGDVVGDMVHVTRATVRLQFTVVEQQDGTYVCKNPQPLRLCCQDCSQRRLAAQSQGQPPPQPASTTQHPPPEKIQVVADEGELPPRGSLKKKATALLQRGMDLVMRRGSGDRSDGRGSGSGNPPA
eukprot:TRINITY_DN60563_c0_g1_i1.p2 TRINITY_DN60563_c0_g1~~TRINITY_DN60563_c0_g1_i1.p2  ORF type:complete len:240 (+),score=71.76 TRINITY_DN60563_c0_g1_i1:114-833(+)